MTTQPLKPIQEEKQQETQALTTLIKDYKAFGVANLTKVRAAQLQEIKKKLRGSVYMKVVKNTIVRRAIKDTNDKKDIDKIEPHLAGSNVLMLTNLNPFKLALLLEQSKVKISAKTGDVAAVDVIVPAGNTGMPPGPIISQLGAVGLATRIESGSVWINKDTMVAKKGDVINERLASVLSKLGIKPVEAGIALKAMYDDGTVFTGNQLHLDLNAYKNDFQTAHQYAFNLVLFTAYPEPEAIPFILQKAHFDAYNLSLFSGFPTKENIRDLIRKAHGEMMSLSGAIAKKDAKAAPIAG
ncbi:MAG TPA: 50S ribosomal protein L10 [Candidatus Krumholzibacteriaceae bacterium]|jgi:large subunit ribosomal protein L10|nr:50S ribosomal protein L10 [Candidatus Krumholzibacteriaceae bacterium]